MELINPNDIREYVKKTFKHFIKKGLQHLMAKERNDDFIQSYSQMINKFTKELANTFCQENGTINWEKLVRFNSAIIRP